MFAYQLGQIVRLQSCKLGIRLERALGLYKVLGIGKQFIKLDNRKLSSEIRERQYLVAGIVDHRVHARRLRKVTLQIGNNRSDFIMRRNH